MPGIIVPNIKKIKRIYSKNSSTTVASTTSATALFTYSIPANTLKVNDRVILKAQGEYKLNTSGHYCTLWGNLGGGNDVANTTQNDAVTSGRHWSTIIELFIKSIGASAAIDVLSKMAFWYDTVYWDGIPNYYTAEDLTSDWDFGLQCTPSANNAGTGMTVYNASIDILRA